MTAAVYAGELGGTAVVCKGTMDGIDGEVALKISRHSSGQRRMYWEGELDKSKQLSEVLPNVAAYHSMVEVEGNEIFPSFGMEAIHGFPILDRNIGCLGAREFNGMLTEKAARQLRTNLETAVQAGWNPSDVQYFLLLEGQSLNGREHQGGDIILFDFASWNKVTGQIEYDVSKPVERLSQYMKK